MTPETKENPLLTEVVALNLIQELKGELIAQTVLAKQGEAYKKRLEKGDSKIKDLEAEIEALNASLAEAKSEMKTLSMKLAASRSTEANARVPGSALKTSALGHRAALGQAKEDLYGDLTGLIMRDVRRDDMEDVFDCIQTGRNGSEFPLQQKPVFVDRLLTFKQPFTSN